MTYNKLNKRVGTIKVNKSCVQTQIKGFELLNKSE